MKKVIKWFVILIVFILLLSLGYEGFKRIRIKGNASTEIWFPADQINMDAVSTVEMEGTEYEILVLSDIQLETNLKKDKEALEMIDWLVEETNPDLILTTGDNTGWILSNFETNKLIKRLDSYNIPWAVVLGNHDSEGMADKLWHGNQYEKGENSLFKMGPSTIHGVGNYIINIEKENKPIYSLIMLDSHDLREYETGTDYDFIYPDQIMWYEWVVKELSQEYNKPIKSMLFTHIPLPEYEYAIEAYSYGKIDEEDVFGEVNENVFCPPINSGLFDKITTLESTTHVFVGHDHINSISLPYQGVRLTYGLKTGETSYSKQHLQGGLLISISETETSIKQINKNYDNLE